MGREGSKGVFAWAGKAVRECLSGQGRREGNEAGRGECTFET